MVAPITVGGGVEIGGGVGIGTAFGTFYNKTTQAFQNVAGSDSTTGFFFQGGGGWLTSPLPSYYDIQPGWTVVGLPGATVVSTDSSNQTVTITGGTFISGSSYAFTGV